jgi:fumarylpyruvate hydrolase
MRGEGGDKLRLFPSHRVVPAVNYCFPAPPQPTLPIAGSPAVFPVHRIYCVGRNYADHAREMGATGREAPFFFCKPADAVLSNAPAPIALPYPDRTEDLQHEVELVVAIGVPGYQVTVEQAAGMVWGYAVGIDLTRRDLQAEAKRQGRPWDVSKGFDRSAPIGAIHPAGQIGPLGARRIWLNVNDSRRQEGNLSEMIWSVEETVSQLSTYFQLAAGDLIFTGTPAGVGKLVAGDRIDAGIDGIGLIHVQINARHK